MSNITVNRAQSDAVIRLLNGIQSDATVAIKRSLNNTATAAKTATARGVGQVITLGARNIKEYISIRRANNDSLSAVVTLSGVLIPAIKFRNRQVRNGVSLKIWKQQRAVKLKHSFYATMQNGHRGIFYRKEISPGVFAPRLPIIERFGPNVTTIYEQTPGLSNDVETQASERLLNQLDTQVNAILNRYA